MSSAAIVLAFVLMLLPTLARAQAPPTVDHHQHPYSPAIQNLIPALKPVSADDLIRFLNEAAATRDDAKQVAAAEAFVARGAWVPHLAVAEATRVLATVYERDPPAVATAVEMLLTLEHLTVQDSEVVAAAMAQFREEPKVGFSDCLLVEVARKAGHTPLGTFDRDLGKLDGAQRL